MSIALDHAPSKFAFTANEFPEITGREEEWRFTPIKRTKGLVSGEAKFDGDITVTAEQLGEAQARRIGAAQHPHRPERILRHHARHVDAPAARMRDGLAEAQFRPGHHPVDRGREIERGVQRDGQDRAHGGIPESGASGWQRGTPGATGRFDVRLRTNGLHFCGMVRPAGRA